MPQTSVVTSACAINQYVRNDVKLVKSYSSRCAVALCHRAKAKFMLDQLVDYLDTAVVLAFGRQR